MSVLAYRTRTKAKNPETKARTPKERQTALFSIFGPPVLFDHDEVLTGSYNI